MDYPYDSIGFSPIYLQHGDQITAPSFIKRTSPPTMSPPLPRPLLQPNSNSNKKHTSRDLLTDHEKRINHIASEQKRRNTIRLGFKDLTEIVPTLKNINNSKSTILFKAVDYVKYLERRNRGLMEKLGSLQTRKKLTSRSSNSQRYKQVFGSDSHALPDHTINALIAHKDQQRQLQELQDQLRAQQQLLTKHHIPISQYHSISIPVSSSNSGSHGDESPLFISPTWHTTLFNKK